MTRGGERVNVTPPRVCGVVGIEGRASWDYSFQRWSPACALAALALPTKLEENRCSA